MLFQHPTAQIPSQTLSWSPCWARRMLQGQALVCSQRCVRQLLRWCLPSASASIPAPFAERLSAFLLLL